GSTFFGIRFICLISYCIVTFGQSLVTPKIVWHKSRLVKSYFA
ncbi:unnamed protein product, partial [Plutella xylostella]